MHNKIYRVGLFGNGANLVLMEELSAVIANEPVSISWRKNGHAVKRASSSAFFR